MEVHLDKILVTTSPRKEETVGKTIDSLILAGWKDNNIILSCDDFQPKIQANVSIVVQPKRLGAWPHWFAALNYLYQHTNQEWLPIIQDDVVFARNVKQYLEVALVPNDCDIYSVFLPANYTIKGVGWIAVNDPSLWMAQTYFVKRSAAQKILTSKVVWKIRGDKQIDNRMGLWQRQSNGKIYYHTPSLAEHIGHSSTLWADAKVEGYRKSVTFVGESFDCLNLL